MKKLICIFICCIILISTNAFSLLTVNAAGYNPSNAVNYANQHWNDGVGKCATFVSNCLYAGGCGAWSSLVVDLRKQLINGGYGTEYLLTENGQSIYLNQNTGKLLAGDPIFFYCKKCGTYTHVVICTGFNNQGKATASGHNAAWNNVTYIAGFIDGSGHSNDDILVYSFHMKTNHQNTVSNPWIKASKSGLFLGESVSFTFGADNTTSYKITIKHHDEIIKTEDNVKSGVSYTFDQEGTYYAYITAKNGDATIDSQVVSFYIVDALDMGSYFIAKVQNPASGYYVAAETLDSNVYLASETTNNNNEWKFIRQEDLSYKIINEKTGDCLGVYGESTDNGTNIGCYQSNDTDSQRWYIRKNLSGYALVPKVKLSSDLSITGNNWIYGECIFDGANISLYENDSVQSQRFTFEYIVSPVNEWIKIDKTILTSAEKLTFNFGAEHTKKYTLHVDFGDGSVLETDINPGEALSFEKSGKCEAYIMCTLEDGNIVNTEKVYFYNMKIHDFGEMFTAKIRNSTSGFYVVSEKTNSDYYNAFMASQELCDNNIWRFVRQEDGSYKIINKVTGLVLSLDGEKAEDKTNIICSPENNDDNQKWFITSNIDGYAFAPKKDYTKYLSVYDNNTIWWYGTPTDGAEVLLYDLDNVQSQRFEFVDYSLYGDIDTDGNVNTGDLASLKLYLAGIYTPTDLGLRNADINADGVVGTGDLADMKLYLAGVKALN